jgi:hypothetical protein
MDLTSRNQAIPGLATILLSLSMIAGLQVLLVQSDVTTLSRGDLVDSDAYMHLLRAQQLYETGRWYDAVSPRSNAPYGELMHWTRPFDLLLLAGGWLGAVFTDFRSALFGWGLIISPVLQALAVIVLYWGTRPYLSRPGFLLAALLFAAQPHIELNFLFGRPDHHGLQLLLLTVVLSALLRHFADPGRGGLVAAAGVATGVSMWVTVEALLVVFIVGAGLGLAWLKSGGRDARDLVVYMVALLATMTLALAIEHPPAEWLAVEYDRLSLVQWMLAAALVVAGVIVASGDRYCRRVGARALLAGAAALIPAAVMAFGFPRFFGGPFVEMDPALGPAWMDTLADAQPLLPTSASLAAQFFMLLGPVLICVPYLLYRLARSNPATWRADLLLLVGVLVYTAEGLYHARAAGFAQLLLVLPWTCLLIALWRADWRLPVGGVRLPVRGPACMVALLGHLIVAAIFVSLPAADPAEARQAACPWPALIDHLNAARPNGGMGILLTPDLYRGPEILYRTPYAIVGTPYHRNEAGILDSYNFFKAADPADAQAIAERRGIGLVLLCRPARVIREEDPKPAQTLADRLARDRPPAWLEPLALPPDITGRFVLYRWVP